MVLKKIVYKLLKYFFIVKTIFSIYAGYQKIIAEEVSKTIDNYPWFLIITDGLFLIGYSILILRVGYYCAAVKIEEWMFEETTCRNRLSSPLSVSILYILVMGLCYFLGDNIKTLYIFVTIFFTIAWFGLRFVRNIFKREYQIMTKA